MAWNARKTDLLLGLIAERNMVTNSPELAVKYGITKNAMQVIGSNCDDATRQAILNELIEDKLRMNAIDKAERQAQANSLDLITTELNSNKE